MAGAQRGTDSVGDSGTCAHQLWWGQECRGQGPVGTATAGGSGERPGWGGLSSQAPHFLGVSDKDLVPAAWQHCLLRPQARAWMGRGHGDNDQGSPHFTSPVFPSPHTIKMSPALFGTFGPCFLV